MIYIGGKETTQLPPAYSKIGLTNVLWKLDLIEVGQLMVKIKPLTGFAGFMTNIINVVAKCMVFPGQVLINRYIPTEVT